MNVSLFILIALRPMLWDLAGVDVIDWRPCLGVSMAFWSLALPCQSTRVVCYESCWFYLFPSILCGCVCQGCSLCFGQGWVHLCFIASSKSTRSRVSRRCWTTSSSSATSLDTIRIRVIASMDQMQIWSFCRVVSLRLSRLKFWKVLNLTVGARLWRLRQTNPWSYHF